MDDAVGVTVEILRADDWAQLRDIRLRALADAPEAFVSLPSRERAWSRHDWLRTFESGAWAVARRTGRVVGLARSAREAAAPGIRHIEAVWVDPAHRRQGVATSLVEALITIERRAGAADVLLWVVAGNQVARRFYEGLGFRPTGECQPIPGDESRREERLRLVTSPNDTSRHSASSS